METPPFTITSKILTQISSIQEVVGELKSYTAVKPSLKLRKENKIKTVHHSLAIEGNSLTEEQMTAILEKKRVIGPQIQILEVKNALSVYDAIRGLNAISERDFLKAHKLLMANLVKVAGKYRSTQVGILKGTKVSHMAPSAKMVPSLMQNLFKFLKKSEVPWLIKACVFHYELEFIHPFEDGNGRMGRLWQQVILMRQSPIFEYISAETLIHKKQKQYYSILEKCDKAGESTAFIEFSLDILLQSLQVFKRDNGIVKLKSSDRIANALEYFADQEFSRKDYLELYGDISTATASRDLSEAVRLGLVSISGTKNKATYRRL